MEITQDQIRAYREDGALCMRGLFGPEEVAQLQDAVDDAAQNLGPFGRNYAGGEGGDFAGEVFVSARVQVIRDILIASPLGEIAGKLMGSKSTRFFFDHMLVKEPGGSNPTPWHQDAPYFPINGMDCCGIWVALDKVTSENGAVEYIKGTHLDNTIYGPKAFSGDDSYEGTGYRELPDIDGNPENYEVLSWELEPGDCTIHHVRLIHGAPANATTAGRRRGIATRWIGDDITFNIGPGVPEDFTNTLDHLKPNLTTGEPFDDPLFPVVWEA